MKNTTRETISHYHKRLLIATGLYAPQIGGPATYTAFLEKHLPPRGVQYRVLPFSQVLMLPSVVRHMVYLWQIIKSGKHADIIYALDTVSVGFPAYLASVILRKPLMIRVPGDYAWEQGQMRFGVTETLDEYLVSKHIPFRVRALAFIQKIVTRHASRVIVPSEYMRRVVETWGVIPERIYRIYSALKNISVKETKAELRNVYQLDGFVIISSARFVPWKGIEILMEVVDDMRNEGHNVRLIIAGDGPLKNDLQERRTLLRDPSSVEFLGMLDRETLGKYIKASDVFALNTSYEGLSHQILEAMSLQTPVVTTPVGGNIELIENEMEGILVAFNHKGEFKEAFIRLMTEDNLSKRFVENALRKLEVFDEEVVIQEFISVLLHA